MAVVAADDSTGFCSCSGAAHDDAFDVSKSEIRDLNDWRLCFSTSLEV